MEEDGGIGNSLNMNGPITITVGNDGIVRLNNANLTINVSGPVTYVSPTGQILSGFQPPPLSHSQPPLSHSQPPLIFQQSLPNVAALTQQVQQLQLENDNHVFKWVDEALVDEIEQLDFQVDVLEEEVRLMKMEKIQDMKELNKKMIIVFCSCVLVVCLVKWYN